MASAHADDGADQQDRFVTLRDQVVGSLVGSTTAVQDPAALRSVLEQAYAAGWHDRGEEVP